jgi:hypothetical protein
MKMENVCCELSEATAVAASSVVGTRSDDAYKIWIYNKNARFIHMLSYGTRCHHLILLHSTQINFNEEFTLM